MAPSETVCTSNKSTAQAKVGIGSNLLKLSNGTLYDPLNRIDGVVRDLWIEDGRIAPEPPHDFTDYRTIDLTGRIVMPGAIDMHTHIAGPKVNVARKMQPEQTRAAAIASRTLGDQFFRSGSAANVPSIQVTGYRYAGLGYTTCFDAAVTPLAARHVHHEFSDLPNVDAGFYTLVGNNHYAMKCIGAGDRESLDAFVGWLLTRTGSYAPKLVNPGGVELWKQSVRGNARDLDQAIDGFNTTPRNMIHEIAASANRLGLPHPVHIHTNNLGLPGNWTTTLETMKTLDGLQAHLAHVQFHSYGGGDGEADSIMSKVAELAEYVNQHKNLTIDVGQVMFGQTTSMTGDAPLGHFLQQLHGERWFASDVELESGCGVSPIVYKNKSFVNALQWAIGLEWFLLIDDPWQVVLTSDHPNGGSFWVYPQIIRLLMDADYRKAMLQTVNPSVLHHSTLADLTREYTLNEIAIITRAAPAKILGLRDKGHLGVGAEADLTVYTPDENYETMFSLPLMVFKGGEILIEDSEIRKTVFGKTISVPVEYDHDSDPHIETWFDRHYSIRSSSFGVR